MSEAISRSKSRILRKGRGVEVQEERTENMRWRRAGACNSHRRERTKNASSDGEDVNVVTISMLLNYVGKGFSLSSGVSEEGTYSGRSPLAGSFSLQFHRTVSA